MTVLVSRASVLALALFALSSVGGHALAQAPSVTTEKPAYEAMEPITVNWANIALVNGWVGIGKPGGDAFDSTRELSKSLPSDWQAKPASGTFTFPGRVGGEYEVRIVTGEHHAPKVVVRKRFTVKE